MSGKTRPTRRAQEIARDEYVNARLMQEAIEQQVREVEVAQQVLTAYRQVQGGHLGVVRELIGDDIDIAHVLACQAEDPAAPTPRSADDVGELDPPGAPLPEDIVNKYGWGYWREWLKKPHLKGNNV